MAEHDVGQPLQRCRRRPVAQQLGDRLRHLVPGARRILRRHRCGDLAAQLVEGEAPLDQHPAVGVGDRDHHRVLRAGPDWTLAGVGEQGVDVVGAVTDRGGFADPAGIEALAVDARGALAGPQRRRRCGHRPGRPDPFEFVFDLVAPF